MIGADRLHFLKSLTESSSFTAPPSVLGYQSVVDICIDDRYTRWEGGEIGSFAVLTAGVNGPHAWLCTCASILIFNYAG